MAFEDVKFSLESKWFMTKARRMLKQGNRELIQALRAEQKRAPVRLLRKEMNSRVYFIFEGPDEEPTEQMIKAMAKAMNLKPPQWMLGSRATLCEDLTQFNPAFVVSLGKLNLPAVHWTGVWGVKGAMRLLQTHSPLDLQNSPLKKREVWNYLKEIMKNI